MEYPFSKADMPYGPIAPLGSLCTPLLPYNSLSNWPQVARDNRLQL